MSKLPAVKDLMNGDYSGENLVAKIIETDEYWESMLNTKGFGRGVKYEKARAYRTELISVWNTIQQACEIKNEEVVARLMGFYLWDLQEDEFTHSYLGVIEEAIKQNKLWKNSVTSDIFCSFLGFVQSESKNLEDIAKEYKLSVARIRQIKDDCLDSFNQDFEFLKDDLINEKLEKLFDLESHTLEQISEQTEEVNSSEGVRFSKEFYTKTLSIAFDDMVLIGNVNDITIQNKRSEKGNVWSNLHLQTTFENQRFNLEGLVDDLAIHIHKNNYRFEEDEVFDISSYVTVDLTEDELEWYNSIIASELEVKAQLRLDGVIIKRNSLITQPEIVELALRELGGFAYADDILEKVIEIHPEKSWSMPVLRTSFRGDNFYAVGKSALFGLKDMNDMRDKMGDGTLNEVIRIYMLEESSPVHIQSLLEHVNSLFPRPKTLNVVHTILEQNSKNYFEKFEGGFYGIAKKHYIDFEFPRIVGAHGKILRQVIEESNGIGFKDVFQAMNKEYGLLEIQVSYLLSSMLETQRIGLTDGLYHRYEAPETLDAEENDGSEISPEEIDIDIDQEELDFDELNQPDVPDQLVKDAIAQIKIRRGQPKFRQKLLTLYRKTCIVTGCQIPELLEAAHIVPHSERGDYHISNGLLLRADIHTLFDLNMIAIEPESMRLKLNSDLLKSGEYQNLENMDIGSKLANLHKEYKVNEEGVQWRWDSFIESD